MCKDYSEINIRTFVCTLIRNFFPIYAIIAYDVVDDCINPRQSPPRIDVSFPHDAVFRVIFNSRLNVRFYVTRILRDSSIKFELKEKRHNARRCHLII